MSKKYSLSTQIFFNPVFILFIFFLQCSKPPTLLNTVGYKKVQSSINSIIQSSGLQTNIGIKVIDLKTNETIYAWNPNSLFNPGSNNKLFTCITALALLDTNKGMIEEGKKKTKKLQKYKMDSWFCRKFTNK